MSHSWEPQIVVSTTIFHLTPRNISVDLAEPEPEDFETITQVVYELGDGDENRWSLSSLRDVVAKKEDGAKATDCDAVLQFFKENPEREDTIYCRRSATTKTFRVYQKKRAGGGSDGGGSNEGIGGTSSLNGSCQSPKSDKGEKVKKEKKDKKEKKPRDKDKKSSRESSPLSDEAEEALQQVLANAAAAVRDAGIPASEYTGFLASYFEKKKEEEEGVLLGGAKTPVSPKKERAKLPDLPGPVYPESDASRGEKKDMEDAAAAKKNDEEEEDESPTSPKSVEEALEANHASSIAAGAENPLLLLAEEKPKTANEKQNGGMAKCRISNPELKDPLAEYLFPCLSGESQSHLRSTCRFMLECGQLSEEKKVDLLKSQVSFAAEDLNNAEEYEGDTLEDDEGEAAPLTEKEKEEGKTPQPKKSNLPPLMHRALAELRRSQTREADTDHPAVYLGHYSLALVVAQASPQDTTKMEKVLRVLRTKCKAVVAGMAPGASNLFRIPNAEQNIKEDAHKAAPKNIFKQTADMAKAEPDHQEVARALSAWLEYLNGEPYVKPFRVVKTVTKEEAESSEK